SFATLCSDCRYGGVSHERRTAMASRTILFSCSRGKLSETLAVISSGRGSPKCSPSVNQQGHVSNSRGILLRIHTILIRQQNQYDNPHFPITLSTPMDLILQLLF